MPKRSLAFATAQASFARSDVGTDTCRRLAASLNASLQVSAALHRIYPFFYALDRDSGAFLSAKAFVKQTWAAGFEPNGRPIRVPESRPTPASSLIWPWVGGGTNLVAALVRRRAATALRSLGRCREHGRSGDEPEWR
jgi:hypothetical protein